jgi:hypothetical protein
MVQNKKMKLDHKKPETLSQINFDFYGPFAVAFSSRLFFSRQFPYAWRYDRFCRS